MLKLSLKAQHFHGILKALALHASTDFTRPHLNAILVRVLENGAVDMVATDGHRLAIYRFAKNETVREERSPKEEVLIRLEDAIAWTKVKLPTGYNADAAQVTIDFEAKTIACEANTRAFVAPDAVFPPYHQVLPQASTSHTEAMNPSYVADACKAFSLVFDAVRNGGKRGGSCPGIVIRGSGENLEPCTFTCPDMPQFAVVVMPWRTEATKGQPLKVVPLATAFAAPSDSRAA